MKKYQFLMSVVVMFSLIGCSGESNIRETLKKNPDILTDAIKANPKLFIDALNEAVKVAQQDQAKEREEEEKKQFEESFNNPLQADIREDELIRGTKGAPIVLVEYSDFECPYCKRGFETVLSVLEKYEGKIQFVYKHLPLSFHPNAMPASKYYEALRMQSEKMAIEFHDEIYKNQSGLRKGESFLKSLAKKVGANMTKLAKDIDSDAVQKRIDQDLAEAKKFGFQGTPGFLLNGIPIKGAYPISHFEMIIGELEKRGKIKL